MKTGTKEAILSSRCNYNNNVSQLLSKGEFFALQNLSKNKDIAIQKANKGSFLVIIDKIDYVNKMEILLNNVSKFQSIDIKKDGFEFCRQPRRTDWQ